MSTLFRVIMSFWKFSQLCLDILCYLSNALKRCPPCIYSVLPKSKRSMPEHTGFSCSDMDLSILFFHYVFMICFHHDCNLRPISRRSRLQASVRSADYIVGNCPEHGDHGIIADTGTVRIFIQTRHSPDIYPDR